MAEQEIKEAGNEQQDGEDKEVGAVVLLVGEGSYLIGRLLPEAELLPVFMPVLPKIT